MTVGAELCRCSKPLRKKVRNIRPCAMVYAVLTRRMYLPRYKEVESASGLFTQNTFNEGSKG